MMMKHDETGIQLLYRDLQFDGVLLNIILYNLMLGIMDGGAMEVQSNKNSQIMRLRVAGLFSSLLGIVVPGQFQ